MLFSLLKMFKNRILFYAKLAKINSLKVVIHQPDIWYRLKILFRVANKQYQAADFA